ncbi:GAF and ANTAR domain-containing protein [soil metagenome]
MTVTMSIDEDLLSVSLADLGPDAEAGRSLEVALRQVVDAACLIFAADGAGLMLIDDSQALHYVSATDSRSAALESSQKQLGLGPCVDSLVHDSVVSTPDLRTDERWPGLFEALAPSGIRAVLGVPVRVGGNAIGSLNAYRLAAHEWDQSELEAIRAYAKVIEDLIGTALLARDRGELATQLEHALEHRVVIERAVGVIMGNQRIDAVAAFDVLRRTARTERRKVADVAAEMLEALR